MLLLHGCPSGRRAVRLRRGRWKNLARGCPGGFAQGPRGRRRAPRVGVPRTIPSPLPARSSLARDADHLIGRRGGLLAGFFLARARLRARFPLAIARDGICRRARTYIARMGRVHRGATPGVTSGPHAERQIAVRPRVPRVERAPSRDGARATGRLISQARRGARRGGGIASRRLADPRAQRRGPSRRCARGRHRGAARGPRRGRRARGSAIGHQPQAR